ncbi:MAG: hypothetical protein QOF44_5842, partial [Streptomyces sp.]|nr:hypothetical protein [Streptomyces sp.]
TATLLRTGGRAPHAAPAEPIPDQHAARAKR